MATATRGQRLLLMGLLTIALMTPPVLLAMVGQLGLASAFFYGGILAVSAVFYDVRLAVTLSMVAGVAGALAALLNPYPIAGAVFFGILTGACALTARRGLHSPVLMIPVFVSFLLVSPPPVPHLSAPTEAVLAGAVLALGGLWGTGSVRLLLGNVRMHLPRTELGARAAIAYGVLMATVLGIATWAVLTYARYHEGAWLLLTLIILMQPSPHDTFSKSLQRLGGTLVGAGIAFAFILIDVDSTFTVIIVGVLVFGALSVRFVLKRPYWEYVTLLTPAVILLSAAGNDRVRIAEERVAFTLIAAMVAIILALAIKAVLVRRAPAEEST